MARLQKEVQHILDNDQLASYASIHNFSCMTDDSKGRTVFCIWPTPRRGYNAEVLFKVQNSFRKQCRDFDPAIGLIGHSMDSAGFSRMLAKWMMTPNEDLASKGILYLGLGAAE